MLAHTLSDHMLGVCLKELCGKQKAQRDKGGQSERSHKLSQLIPSINHFSNLSAFHFQYPLLVLSVGLTASLLEKYKRLLTSLHAGQLENCLSFCSIPHTAAWLIALKGLLIHAIPLFKFSPRGTEIPPGISTVSKTCRFSRQEYSNQHCILTSNTFNVSH